VRLLALDTSSLACSVALMLGDDIVERHEEQPREHTRLLVPMINEVLAEGDISPADLDAIALGNGPGSFIGMRIATSVAQGMAFAAGIKVVPVSSLLAVAAETMAAEDAEYVAVCQDAHMNEVYLGLYSAGQLPKLLCPERIQSIAAIEEVQNLAGRFVAAGFGWDRYPELLDANRAALRKVADVRHPRARCLLPTGSMLLQEGASLAPDRVTPAYLRDTVARRPAP
jgi:tRNA threonylcarbamoyladenosine biosynthesis protein TsaB